MSDQQQIEGQSVPKMNDQLAAESDIAAIEYGNTFGKDEIDHCDLTNAHEAGQSWMYRKFFERKEAIDLMAIVPGISAEAIIQICQLNNTYVADYEKALFAAEQKIKELTETKASPVLPPSPVRLPDGSLAGPASAILQHWLGKLYDGFNIKMFGAYEHRMLAFINGLVKDLEELDWRPPSPVGEAGEELPIPPDIENWFVENSASYETLHPKRGMGRSIFEDGAYQMYQKLQPIINHLNAQLSANPSRAGEISPVLRWVKASERLPEAKSNIFFKYSYPGYPIEKLSGSLIDYSNDEEYFVAGGLSFNNMEYLEWLEEIPPTPAPEVKGEDYPHSEEVHDLKNIIRSLEEQRNEYRLLFDKWTALAGETGVLFGWQDFWKECKALKIKYPMAPTEPVKDNPVEQQDERPGCWDGKCTAPKGAKGITNCLECGGELQQVGNLWYHHSSFDKGRLVAGAQAQDSAPSEQPAYVPDKERRLAIGFAIWATEQGWLIDPDSEEDEEPGFYKPSDDFDIPDDRMFGGQLYDLYLQHLNGSEMPPTDKQPIHVPDSQNVLWDEIRKEMTGGAFSFPRPDIVDEWAGKYTISHKAEIVEEIAAPDPKGEVPEEITGDNLKEWALAESKDLVQRDKDFFFMGVGHLYERIAPQIATLTQQRDEAVENLGKMIDVSKVKSDEAGEYRKALESWKFTLTGSTGQSAAYLQAMAVLAKYPSLDKNQTNE